MRDQFVGIYLLPIVTQVLAPLALLAWQAFGRETTRAAWVLKTTSIAAYLIAIVLAGLWLVAPWPLSIVYLLIFFALILSTAQRIPRTTRWPGRFPQWIGLALRGAFAIASIGLLLYAMNGREPPSEEVVDLDFPLRNGAYMVVAGGSNELLSPHVQTLTGERLRDYRGQSYGIDIVEVNALGMRARGIAPRDPREYIIFGESVYAPCSGTVLRAENGFDDMPPLQPDRDHLAGNHVFLDCSGRRVLLAHLQKGTVRVHPGDRLATGTLLGQAGNSGNTGEPHLHVHAQRPSKGAAFLSGDPLPIRFDKRFLARNDWVRRDVSPLAPPVGGLLALAGLFILGFVYWFPMRALFREWGATGDEVKRSMAADAEVPVPDYKTTLAFSIHAPADAVWPWLVQMGYQRAGLYSYDWLDRSFGYLDRPSADRLLPEFQNLEVGDVIPIGAGAGFPVKAIDPPRTLLLAGQADGVRWAWQLELLAIDSEHTRLISRNCVAHPRSLKNTAFIRLIEPTAFIMTRKMLLGIKRRAERLAAQKHRIRAA
jgi:hypothetical protein